MIHLELTDEQARIVACACEFYARIRMGQFSEISHHTIDLSLPTDDYCSRREQAEAFLYKARDYIYPELYGPGHSYGYGKFKDADQAFDVYQVIRYANGDNRRPFSYYDLPKCEKVETGIADKKEE